VLVSGRPFQRSEKLVGKARRQVFHLDRLLALFPYIETRLEELPKDKHSISWLTFFN